jgi:hypothetical protein
VTATIEGVRALEDGCFRVAVVRAGGVREVRVGVVVQSRGRLPGGVLSLTPLLSNGAKVLVSTATSPLKPREVTIQAETHAASDGLEFSVDHRGVARQEINIRVGAEIELPLQLEFWSKEGERSLALRLFAIPEKIEFLPCQDDEWSVAFNAAKGLVVGWDQKSKSADVGRDEGSLMLAAEPSSDQGGRRVRFRIKPVGEGQFAEWLGALKADHWRWEPVSAGPVSAKKGGSAKRGGVASRVVVDDKCAVIEFEIVQQEGLGKNGVQRDADLTVRLLGKDDGLPEIARGTSLSVYLRRPAETFKLSPSDRVPLGARSIIVLSGGQVSAPSSPSVELATRGTGEWNWASCEGTWRLDVSFPQQAGWRVVRKPRRLLDGRWLLVIEAPPGGDPVHATMSVDLFADVDADGRAIRLPMSERMSFILRGVSSRECVDPNADVWTLDFGTTNSCVSVWAHGREPECLSIPADILRSADAGSGGGIIPTRVGFQARPDGDEDVFIGRDCDQIDRTKDALSWGVFAQFKPAFEDDKELAPRESAKFNRTEKQTRLAEVFLGEFILMLRYGVGNACPQKLLVTYPAVVSIEYRATLGKVLEDVARQCGIVGGCELYIDEATAAAMGELLALEDQGPEKSFALLFDFGGGTMDIALLKREVVNQRVTIYPVGVTGLRELGGRNITHCIAREVRSSLASVKNFAKLSDDTVTRLAEAIKLNWYASGEGDQLKGDTLRQAFPAAYEAMRTEVLAGRLDGESLNGEVAAEVVGALKVVRRNIDAKILPMYLEIVERARRMCVECTKSGKPDRIILCGQSSGLRHFRDVVKESFDGISLFEVSTGGEAKQKVAIGAARYDVAKRGGALIEAIDARTVVLRPYKQAVRSWGDTKYVTLIEGGRLIPDKDGNGERCDGSVEVPLTKLYEFVLVEALDWGDKPWESPKQWSEELGIGVERGWARVETVKIGQPLMDDVVAKCVVEVYLDGSKQRQLTVCVTPSGGSSATLEQQTYGPFRLP